MAFMTETSGGGDFNIYVKYNAKAGRWYTKADDTDPAEEFEVTDMTAVIDFRNLQTGWFLFEAGVAPSRVIDDVVGIAGPKPGDRFKRGFQCLFFSPKNFPAGGIREFATTAMIVQESFNALHDAYLSAPETKAGQLPVVKCSGTTPISSKHGTNYQPILEIVKWVDVPEALEGVALEGSSDVVAPAATTTAPAAAETVAPPAAKTTAAPAPTTAPAADSGNLF